MDRRRHERNLCHPGLLRKLIQSHQERLLSVSGMSFYEVSIELEIVAFPGYRTSASPIPPMKS
jgi:hypothetical protein